MSAASMYPISQTQAPGPLPDKKFLKLAPSHAVQSESELSTLQS